MTGELGIRDQFPQSDVRSFHADMLAAGTPINTRWDPCMYSPIYEDDINHQVGALLEAATSPATIVNWAGDEPVSAQEWCAYAGELMGIDGSIGVTPIENTLRGSIADNAKRLSITGPCAVGWREGLRRTVVGRHPDRYIGPPV